MLRAQSRRQIGISAMTPQCANIRLEVCTDTMRTYDRCWTQPWKEVQAGLSWSWGMNRRSQIIRWRGGGVWMTGSGNSIYKETEAWKNTVTRKQQEVPADWSEMGRILAGNEVGEIEWVILSMTLGMILIFFTEVTRSNWILFLLKSSIYKIYSSIFKTQ